MWPGDTGRGNPERGNATMNDQKIHDALDAVFNYELSRWMKASANTPPQSLRDGIGAVLNAAFYGSMDADELARNLETAERALWHARREVERVRDGLPSGVPVANAGR
jgi:hypothetical protein